MLHNEQSKLQQLAEELMEAVGENECDKECYKPHNCNLERIKDETKQIIREKLKEGFKKWNLKL